MGRRSGILLHISSLPSRFGIGDFGSEAYNFVDFLFKTKQKYWQVLPFTPTLSFCGNSPYSSISSRAGNTLFISLEKMVEQGFLSEKQLSQTLNFPAEYVDYEKVSNYKNKMFNLAYQEFKKQKGADKTEYKKFCKENQEWLDDYAQFIVFKDYFKGEIWVNWPQEIRDRDKKAVSLLSQELADSITREKFLQYIFLKQWLELKKYANCKAIEIIGDMPIYVNFDSVDVWSNQDIFKLDKNKNPVCVAGVPPDYFSATGQLWGNPVYSWEALERKKFRWWIERFRHNLLIYDFVRVDHFRGFVAYWEVPVSEKTAINGTWVNVPADKFFKVLLKHFPAEKIIAEDLGVITEDVRKVMRKFGFIGMKILLFAFGDDLEKNPYLPHNHIPNCIIYTGTHDNNTVYGWFQEEADNHVKEKLFKYLGKEVSPQEINQEFIRMAMTSVAKLSLIPLQDILGLGAYARMNQPGKAEGNWRWRFVSTQLNRKIEKMLKDITVAVKRTNA